MPGEELDDALLASRTLAASGASVVLTMLGENLGTVGQTRDVVREYLAAMDRAEELGLDLEVSVKPTHLGLDQDRELVLDNISELAARTGDDRTVWIDMEGSVYKEPTLDLYRALGATHDNVGVCLQSYLRQTPADLERLLPLSPRIRLVKGAYAEPTELAFPDKSDVDAAYRRLADTMFRHFRDGGGGMVALGTHDPELIGWLNARIDEIGVDRDRYEFEMLYGIGLRQQQRLLEDGQPLRVLISYGDAWFPWYMRRLAERPANVWFVARSLFR